MKRRALTEYVIQNRMNYSNEYCVTQSPRHIEALRRLAEDEFLKFEWSSHWENLDVKPKQQSTESQVGDVVSFIL